MTSNYQDKERNIDNTLPNKTINDREKYSMISTEDNSLELIDVKIEKEEIISSGNKDDDAMKVFTPLVREKNMKYCSKRIGNTFAFMGDKDGNPAIIVGPHWPMYFCFCGIVTGGYMMFFFNFWPFIHPLLRLIGVIVYGTFASAYTMAFLINPGYPLLDMKSKTGHPRNEYRFCSECKLWVSIVKETTHCRDCNICVEGIDIIINNRNISL